MISVVYCTPNSTPEHLSHIKNTVGVKNVEIIEYINKGEPLTKFYNKALKETKNDIVVFCHNDILFNTKDWGKKIISHFKNSDFGILGVAGTTEMQSTGMWWQNPSLMLGQVRHTHEGKSWLSTYSPKFGSDIMESILVDGLFFVVKKSKLKENFDENILGFHFYEIDFCFNNHLNGVRVGVISDINITHKSIGQTNDEWEKNRRQFVEKYSQKLPYSFSPQIFFKEEKIKLKKQPKVGVIIPTKGNVNLLKDCVDSIFNVGGYQNLTIYIADTGSSNEELNEIKSFVSSNKNIKLVEYDYYNFSSINNDVVFNHVDGDVELVLFSNNDIKLLNNAIKQMVDVFNKNKQTGTVGIRLHFGDNKIQHSGVIAFVDNNYNIRVSHHGLGTYFNYHQGLKEVFGNTAAFMMIRKSLFEKIGGFNEKYNECFEDVELNVECLNRRYKNYFIGTAVAYHYESQTRNKDKEKLKKESEDYIYHLLPKIINSRGCYNNFSNIDKTNLSLLIKNKYKTLTT